MKLLSSSSPLASSRLDWHALIAVALLFSSLASTVLATSPPPLGHPGMVKKRHPNQHLKKSIEDKRNTEDVVVRRTVNSRRASTCKSKTDNNATNPPKNTTTPTTPPPSPPKNNTGSCFPSLGYTPPSGTPTTSLDSHWCDPNDEAGFLGFSYGTFGCQSKSKLSADFKKMRSTYNTRYVRVYGNCPNERATFLDDIIEAAYENGMGVMALVWLGWDTSDTSWKARLSHIQNTIKTNPLAPYVIRSVDVGSEPLLDQPVSPNELLTMIKQMKTIASPKGIKVGISDMRYSYSKVSSSIAKQIFDESEYVHAHELSFLSGSATTGTAAWKSVSSDLKWFSEQSGGKKKILITQTGWPTNQNLWKSASKNVDDSVSSAQSYAEMLNSHCNDMKTIAGNGGVGWFWQTWSETDLSGWGLIKSNGQPQFTFKGTAC